MVIDFFKTEKGISDFYQKTMDITFAAGIVENTIEGRKQFMEKSWGCKVFSGEEGICTCHPAMFDFLDAKVWWNGNPASCDVLPIAFAMVKDCFWPDRPITPRLKDESDDALNKFKIASYLLGHGSKRGLSACMVLIEVVEWWDGLTEVDDDVIAISPEAP